MAVRTAQYITHLRRFPFAFTKSQWLATAPLTRTMVTEAEQGVKSETQQTESEKTLMGEVEKLKTEVSSLIEKKKELEDKYKRSLADGENMRVRLTKQISDAKIFGIQSFCKDLLDVSDILEQATSSVPKEEINDKNPHLKNLFEGLTMTKAQLHQVFKRNGLEPINPLNEKFNPNFHEALFQQEVPNTDPNTVIIVSKVGYKLHERCIRPAVVGVSK